MFKFVTNRPSFLINVRLLNNGENVKSKSFSVQTLHSIERILSDVKYFAKLQKKGNSKRINYQFVIMNNNSNKNKSAGFKLQDENLDRLFEELKTFILKKKKYYSIPKRTHMVTVMNVLTKENDNKSASFCTDLSLAEIRRIFRKYIVEIVAPRLDDKIVFFGEKGLASSHRVVIYTKHNNIAYGKSLCTTIRIPHYSSKEILDELCKMVDDEKFMEANIYGTSRIGEKT